MKIKFTRKSIKAINKWLKRNGFTTTCRLSNKYALCYDLDENEILVPPQYDGDKDDLFMKCLRDLKLTSDFDAVTLSILHELGHAQTAHLFTYDEWNGYNIVKGSLALVLDENDDDFYFKYWEVEDEKAANSWLTMYVNCLPKKVQKLEDIIETTIKFG